MEILKPPQWDKLVSLKKLTVLLSTKAQPEAGSAGLTIFPTKLNKQTLSAPILIQKQKR